MTDYTNLFLWSHYMDGARDLLLKLKDGGVLLETQFGKENKVYSDAIYTMLFSDKRNMQNFLYGETICFRNHERNKKGKLIKCEAYYKND